MKTLYAPTEDFIRKERTTLNADVTAGTNVSLTLKDNTGMAQNTFIVVGREGSETAEVSKINASVTAGVTVQVATLVFSHKADEPVTVYRYDKRKFYGCATLAGAYVELTGDGSPVAIRPDDTQGALLEYTGSTYTYFKSTYYNSVDATETNIADANGVLADETTRYCSIYSIRRQAGLTNNPYISDGYLETYRKRAESEVKSYLASRYVLPLVNSTGIAEIPFIVENCTVLLAAGYMDYQEFGKDGEGVKWLGEARSLLKKIRDGEQALLGSDDVEMSSITVLTGIQGFPDSVDNNNGPVRYFGMGQRF